MANTLKVITASASDIDGSGGDLAANTDEPLYTVPGSTTAIVVGFHVCNILTNTIKITVTISSDTGSNATGRNMKIDLSDIIGDSGIQTIAPCRSPLTSGYTVSKSGYMNYGDGTIDRGHLGDQRCRALHMMYWVSTS